MPEVDSGYGVWRATIWGKQYQDVLGAAPKDLSAVLVLRHNGITLAMQQAFWDKYGVGRNPKCDNCMAHCGYEGTAVEHTLASPLTALSVFLFGPRLDGEMAPELPVLHGGQAPGVAIPIDQIGRLTRRD